MSTCASAGLLWSRVKTKDAYWGLSAKICRNMINSAIMRKSRVQTKAAMYSSSGWNNHSISGSHAGTWLLVAQYRAVGIKVPERPLVSISEMNIMRCLWGTWRKWRSSTRKIRMRSIPWNGNHTKEIKNENIRCLSWNLKYYAYIARYTGIAILGGKKISKWRGEWINSVITIDSG